MDEFGSSLLEQHYEDCLPLNLLRVYTQADMVFRFKRERKNEGKNTKAKAAGKLVAISFSNQF